MGWFNKKEKKEKKELSSLPDLPELPKLPELEKYPKDNSVEPVPRLPSFPSNSFGEKFSQDMIKEAVSRGKESDEESYAEEAPMKPRPLQVSEAEEFRPRKLSLKSVPSGFEEAARKVKRAEPIFIRIDKFEESLKIFEHIKQKISEIDKMLGDIKNIKEKEEKELVEWESEIQLAKKQIEKIDEDVFSKVE